VETLKRRRGEQPATPQQAQAVLAAVHRIGHYYPGRVACLEHSLGAVVGLALIGLNADWCLGYAHDPYRFHAWVEVGGAMVAHPGDADPLRYHTVLTI
jgi:hypothetical protein